LPVNWWDKSAWTFDSSPDCQSWSFITVLSQHFNSLDQSNECQLTIWPNTKESVRSFLMNLITSKRKIQKESMYWPIDRLPLFLAYDINDLILIIIWKTYCSVEILLSNYRTRWQGRYLHRLNWQSKYNRMARQTRSDETPFWRFVDWSTTVPWVVGEDPGEFGPAGESGQWWGCCSASSGFHAPFVWRSPRPQLHKV